MHHRSILSVSIALAVASGSAAADELEAVVIGADPLGQTAAEIPGSVSVVEGGEIQDRGATHFGDLLLDLPNLNFSGQSSRPRHLQIRGIGELDEYTGKPNPSVGFVVDGVDFSGIGMTGNLFDVEQVEVLRGPQGFRFGDGALAGLVNIETRDPTPYPEAYGEATVGEDDLWELGAVSSGPVNEQGTVMYRIAGQLHRDDGFRHNDYLDREDTNGRDEALVRGKLRWQPDSDLTADLTLTHNDLDNGYDAWSLDNSYTTQSNEPGKDTQLSNAAALEIDWSGHRLFRLVSETAVADSEMEYSYDADWVHPGYVYDNGATPFLQSTFRNLKDRQTFSQELRWHSTEASRLFDGRADWVAGVYFKGLDEDNHTAYTFDPKDKRTDYQARNLAGFGQLKYRFSSATRLTSGLRVERRETEFTSNYGDDFSPEDTSVGAQLSLSHDLGQAQSVYALVSRGYKAGGYNAMLPASLKDDLQRFEEETLWNYELGWRGNWPDRGLRANVTAFYMDRSDAQFNSYAEDAGVYYFFTENFASATNYGIESDLNLALSERWSLFGSLGLLQTSIEDSAEYFSLDGREAPHAPNYQASLGVQYRDAKGWFGRLEGRAVDDFYFSPAHDQQSEAYEVVNVRVGYEAPRWEAYLWGKNVFDERYATRGFYIDNTPPTYTDPERYVRLGDPRQFGVTARFYFQ